MNSFPTVSLVTHAVENSSSPFHNQAANACVAIVAFIFQVVAFRIIILTSNFMTTFHNVSEWRASVTEMVVSWNRDRENFFLVLPLWCWVSPFISPGLFPPGLFSSGRLIGGLSQPLRDPEAGFLGKKVAAGFESTGTWSVRHCGCGSRHTWLAGWVWSGCQFLWLAAVPLLSGCCNPDSLPFVP